jgi:hypothetical protein
MRPPRLPVAPATTIVAPFMIPILEKRHRRCKMAQIRVGGDRRQTGQPEPSEFAAGPLERRGHHGSHCQGGSPEAESPEPSAFIIPNRRNRSENAATIHKPPARRDARCELTRC